jgi:hypothetical protein
MTMSVPVGKACVWVRVRVWVVSRRDEAQVEAGVQQHM